MMPLDSIAVATISFLIGNVSGFFISKMISKNVKGFDQDQRINYLIIVVSLMWVASLIVDILSPQYETSPLVHGIMGAIVGFFFWKPKQQ